MGAKIPPAYISEFSAEQTKWPGFRGGNSDVWGGGPLSWRQEEREGPRGESDATTSLTLEERCCSLPLPCPVVGVAHAVWVKLLRRAVLGTTDS